MEEVQTLERMPQQAIDFAQLAPLVTEFQKGEVEKLELQTKAQVAIAQMNADRQKEVDKMTAAREIRLDRYKGITTAALFIGCAGMTGYGMWNRDTGFITAGVSSFAAFLAGAHGSSKPKA
ncbi:MAG: hypothetical protein ACXVZR_03850 [Terriglobales bacterium]